MLTLLLGTNQKQNTDYIFQRMAQAVNDRQSGMILMVPELISHQRERELAAYCGPTASRFAEVLSYSRLAKRVAEEEQMPLMECLDAGGRIVAMAAAARQIQNKLKAYASVQSKPEFLLGLLDAVDEFKRCCITPEDLMAASHKTQGSLAQKLEELSLILEAYNSICQRGKRDPRDQMNWLLDALEDCEYAQNHRFYFDGFPAFSRQHMEILYHLIRNSPDVLVSLDCDCINSQLMAFEESGATAADIISFAISNQLPYQVVTLQPDITKLQYVADHLMQGKINKGEAAGILRVTRTESAYDACALIAEQITEKIVSGGRYRDFNIVCTDLQSFRGPIRWVMERAHIPVYLSGTEEILDKTVIHTVLSALDAALGGFDTKEVLIYLKSNLSPVTREITDQIENYVIMWSVDGNSWLKPWENHPRGLGETWTDYDKKTLALLNEARNQAIKPLQQLRDRFRVAIGVREQVVALYDFLNDISLHKRLQCLAEDLDRQGDNRNAQMMNQLWDILVGALEQIYDVLSETSWDADTFTKLLRLLLSQYDVGSIPSVLDAVKVGSVSAMRCENCRHLFVLGASEGLLPTYGTSAGVLNDQERGVLQKLGVPINPGAIEGLQTQFSEIREVFSGAEDSVTVYCCDGQPSFIYNRLKEMAGEETYEKPQFGPAMSDTWEATGFLLRNELLSQTEAMDLHTEADTILSCRDYNLGEVQPENITELYGNKLNLSASQIDRLAECRLSYFLKYGIRAQERKIATIDPAEFGTYVHAVLEECGKKIVALGGFRQVTLEKTLEIASEISAQYFAARFSGIGTERTKYLFQKNTREVEWIVSELWKEMQESSFDAAEFELSFGDDGKMPAVSISGKSLNASLRGFVDRVDKWVNGENCYVRVVDYKTGKKDFDYCDIFNGIGLQMLLYLYALTDGGEKLFGEKPLAAGVQYFPARVPYVSADGSISAQEAEEAHAKELKRKGLLLDDAEVLYAIENSEIPKRIPVKKTKDGSLTGDLASSHQFYMLKKYIYKLLEGLVDDISSGNVTPNPYTRGASHNACRFCPYGSVCHSADVEGRRNYRAMNADRFWTDIEKEVENNG